MNQIIKSIFNGEGFFTDKTLESREFNHLYKIVQKSYSDVLNIYYPKIKKNYLLQEYSDLKLDEDHKRIWTKKNRLLKEKDIVEWLKMSELISYLNKIFGEVEISDEEKLGFPNVYWRLVRPNTEEDIGPLHRDEWFWLINRSSKIKTYHTRIKVWIPLLTEKGQNGLLVLPNSHKDEKIQWTKFEKNGQIKPKLNSFIKKENLKLLNLDKKNLVIFNDKLLHGGAINKGKLPRVSIEFTLFIKNKRN